MRNADCRIREKTFLTALGWAGTAASDKGVSKIVLPRASKEAVEQELTGSERGVRNADRNVQLGLSVQILNRAVLLLQAYFSGKAVVFDLPLDIRCYTAFQKAVWKAAVKIPSGETRSYAWVAEKIGNPLAVRAVGQAMGANPIPVIIP